MKHPARLLAGLALALAALLAALAPGPRAQTRPPDMQFSLAPMLEKVIPAVVSVRVAGERYRPVEIGPVSASRAARRRRPRRRRASRSGPAARG
jgi:S1-C subfamily serine protease